MRGLKWLYSLERGTLAAAGVVLAIILFVALNVFSTTHDPVAATRSHRKPPVHGFRRHEKGARLHRRADQAALLHLARDFRGHRFRELCGARARSSRPLRESLERNASASGLQSRPLLGRGGRGGLIRSPGRVGERCRRSRLLRSVGDEQHRRPRVHRLFRSRPRTVPRVRLDAARLRSREPGEKGGGHRRTAAPRTGPGKGLDAVAGGPADEAVLRGQGARRRGGRDRRRRRRLDGRPSRRALRDDPVRDRSVRG